MPNAAVLAEKSVAGKSDSRDNKPFARRSSGGWRSAVVDARADESIGEGGPGAANTTAPATPLHSANGLN